MNNVIVILIDSLNTKSLGTGRTKISSTPFMDKIAKEGLFANNFYSYGPYTDAATKGLFCGNRSLDDYGYYFGINSSKYNHYKIFKENGYETYGFFYPYYLISTNKQKDIDHRIYTSGFVFSSIWFGKFSYYQNLQKQRALTEDEYLVLSKCLELVFDCWTSFYSDLSNNEESRQLIAPLLENVDIKECKELLKKEKQSYYDDKKKYLDALLEKGMDHPLAKLDKIDVDKMVDKKFVKECVYKKHHQFFKELHQKTKQLNKKNNPFDKVLFKKSIKNLLFKRDRGGLRYLANCYLSRNTAKYQKRNTFKPLWQYESSTMSQIMALEQVLDQRNHANQPFYAFLHLEEPHERISFFSYDICDESLIDEEIKCLYDTLKEVGDDFKGSLIYQLSIRYVDFCLEKLYNYLLKKNLLENTTILITADHGSSYSFYPIRKEVVNCFYRENYNVPLFIWQKNHRNEFHQYEGMYQAKDILPTLIDLVGIKNAQMFSGKPIYQNENGEEYMITEYMGPGCPDMMTRDVWMSIRGPHYLLAFKQPIYQAFDVKYMCEAYNLLDDPSEKANIKEKIDFGQEEIKKMLSLLEKRFDEIKKNKEQFLSDLRNDSIVL